MTDKPLPTRAEEYDEETFRAVRGEIDREIARHERLARDHLERADQKRLLRVALNAQWARMQRGDIGMDPDAQRALDGYQASVEARDAALRLDDTGAAAGPEGTEVEDGDR